MPRLRVAIFALSLLLGSACLAGILLWDPVPEPVLVPPGDLPTEPSRVEAWLQASEARFPDIRPGAEKHVAWADPANPAPTPLSIVYLHGYSACRLELSPVFENVGQRVGANVFFTRLTGHGRTGAAMAEATVQSWVDDGLEALALGHLLGDRVVLVGTSTGGTLAAWLAARQADLDALILISPNFGVRAAGSSLLLWPGRTWLVHRIVGPERSWTPANPAHAAAWTWRYPSEALFPMAELVALADRTSFAPIRVPVLAVYSPEDQVIRAEQVPVRVGHMSSPLKRLVEMPESEDESDHVLAGDILSPGTNGTMVQVVERFLADAFGEAPSAGPPPGP